jgi:hypothetical protein
MQKQNLVSWSNFEALTAEYHISIEPLVQLEKNGVLSKSQIENLLPPILLKLHSTLTTILNENGVDLNIKNDEKMEKSKIQIIIKAMQAIQAKIMS